jgi:hypothetical protein
MYNIYGARLLIQNKIYGISLITMHGMRAGVHSTLGSSPCSLVFNRDMFLNMTLIVDWHAITQCQKHFIRENLMREIHNCCLFVCLFVCLFASFTNSRMRMTPRSVTSEMCVLHRNFPKIWQAPKNTLMKFYPSLCMPLKQQYILPWEVAPEECSLIFLCLLIGTKMNRFNK